MTDYIEIQIEINPSIEDVISEMCFNMFNCEGIVIAEESYKNLEMTSTTEGTLRVFLKGNLSDDEILSGLNIIKDTLIERGLTTAETGSFNHKIIECKNQDWSKKWKEKWDITHVSENMVVVPDWLEYTPKREEVIIKLEPGCAFGTGTHATTQLCMKAIEKYMPQNADVADVGTGSGILAICAKKFGARNVYGCDNDETVINVAKENALKNHVECIFELNTADKINKQFDFVTANILHNVLADIMSDLKNIMKNNAYLILSGILEDKKQIVLDAVKNQDLQLIEEMNQEQWIALIVQKMR